MDSDTSLRHPCKLVSIGSIAAASLLANAFADQRGHLAAIVPVTDTGSSTGIIRDRFALPAPGDVRAVLAAMGEDAGEKALLKELFEYRLREEEFPELKHMALGNLVIAALAQVRGSFAAAVKDAAALLGVKGRVLPVITASTHLVAELVDGRVVRGEAMVRQPGKAPIRVLSLEDLTVRLAEDVAEALADADLVVIGPGCLYTSVIACLVVPGFAEALERSQATRVFCCNTTTTPGQTDGLSVLDHVKTLTRYLNGIPLHYALLNNRLPGPAVVEAYRRDNVHPVLPTASEVEEIRRLGCTPVLADLIEERWAGKRMLHKLDTIRHDPVKVRKTLLNIMSSFARRP